MQHGSRLALALIAAVAVLGGCQSDYRAQWEEAAAAPRGADSIAGAWAGTWQSAADDGDSGRLWAIITPADGESYRIEYLAEYDDSLYRHTATMHGQATDGAVELTGQEDLGLGGGLYRYRGYATPVQFFLTYESEDNEGTYLLGRPRHEPTQSTTQPAQTDTAESSDATAEGNNAEQGESS